MANGIETAIAVNRFGIGARPGELGLSAKDPKARLESQVAAAAGFRVPESGLVSKRKAAETLSAYLRDQRAKSAGRKSMSSEAQEEAILKPLKALHDVAAAEIEARAIHGLTTPNGFAERLVHFWSTHFAVSATRVVTFPLVGIFEREAIRNRMTGTFADMLLASTRDPGILHCLAPKMSRVTAFGRCTATLEGAIGS